MVCEYAVCMCWVYKKGVLMVCVYLHMTGT